MNTAANKSHDVVADTRKEVMEAIAFQSPLWWMEMANERDFRDVLLKFWDRIPAKTRDGMMEFLSRRALDRVSDAFRAGYIFAKHEMGDE